MLPFRLVKDKQAAPQISTVKDGLRCRTHIRAQTGRALRRWAWQQIPVVINYIINTVKMILSIHVRGSHTGAEGPKIGHATSVVVQLADVSAVVERVSRRG